ncbi:hypothetical protein PCASD_04218 [Puccinia coronata f. sp. avenae]|uniref:Pre-rRNA-processing protein PNO1 n=1 Tax=Puccinia coronata f. sp. avenae TaxID=200324 RepID=A0A2N5VEM3_9BASI|nr:hypothetical protein PCASD_25575 [Puccinia coronata f. sp. avenae]PLW48452.1 hypothetical protein PCASD_04218 [Puccinia coronata f. sp. avenae]
MALPSQPSNDDAVMIDLAPIPEMATGPSTTSHPTTGPSEGLLDFGPVKEQGSSKGLTQTAKVSISPQRLTPLKKAWPQIYTPLVEELGLMVRMNVGSRRVELKSTKHTVSPASSTLTKAANFLQCFNLGFAVDDALALLRLEEIYIESFEIKDVKSLTGDHLSRAIGRIAGKDGRTRFTIENASRTRIVLADTKIHILGSFAAIRIARDAICALILGSPPGKVYHGLRTVAARQRERF